MIQMLQDLSSKNASLEARFRELAAATKVHGPQHAPMVAAIFAESADVEGLLSKITSAASALIESLKDSHAAGPKCRDERVRIRKAFNQEHIRALVRKGLQLRMAAKQFLVKVLVLSDWLLIDDSDVHVGDAGKMGKGLFASRELGAGRKIGEYSGEHLDAAGLGLRYKMRQGEFVMRTSPTTWVRPLLSDCLGLKF